MTVFKNPFGTHTVDGVYLDENGADLETFRAGDSYLVHQTADGEWDFREFRITSGEDAGKLAHETLGPQTFGSLFLCIPGFHGFHISIGLRSLIVAHVSASTSLH